MVVGMDVSKDWLDAAWREGEKLRWAKYDYMDQWLGELLEEAPSAAQFVMEATGTYHARAALRLLEAGRAVSVVNPLVIKRYGQMKLSRAKSDRADAQLIMRYGEEHAPPLWRPCSEEVQALQQAHGWLEDLPVERTRLLNRQHAHGLRTRPDVFVKRQMNARLKRLDRDTEDCLAPGAVGTEHDPDRGHQEIFQRIRAKHAGPCADILRIRNEKARQIAQCA